MTDFSLIGYDLEATLKTGISAAVIAAELIVLSHLCTYLILSWIGTTRFRNPIPGPLPANPPQVAVTAGRLLAVIAYESVFLMTP